MNHDGISERARAGDAAAELMPPVAHWPDKTRPFTYADSGVAKWLMQQPAVVEEMVHWAITAKARRGAIVFNGKTGLWTGAGAGAVSARIQARNAQRIANRKGVRTAPATEFKRKWTDEQFLAALLSEPGCETAAVGRLATVAREQLGMSEATFCRFYRRLRGQLKPAEAVAL